MILTVAALLLLTAVAYGEPPPQVSPKDKCGVCGMFVAKYPEWTSSLTFRDGKTVFFDGPKDLFRFRLNLEKYAPGRGVGDTGKISVKDYYSLRTIDGDKACYVAGSDVFGPMGKELVPFASRRDAEGFRKDHAGKGIYTAAEITAAVLKQLE